MVKTRGTCKSRNRTRSIVADTCHLQKAVNRHSEVNTNIGGRVEAEASTSASSAKTQELVPEVEARVPQPDDAALPQMAILSPNCSSERLHNGTFQTAVASVEDKDTLKECKPKPLKSGKKVTKNDTKTKRNMTKNSNDVAFVEPGVQQPEPLPVVTTKPTHAKRKNKETQPRLMTDYFPVRRSGRKTLKSLAKEKHKTLEEAIISGNEDGFQIKEFLGKGRGIITNKAIRQGEYVLEYCGELINVQEAKGRELAYAADKEIGCYMYYFHYKNKQYCVDATHETSRLGRLVNHSKKGNLLTKPFLVGSIPHLILVAQRDITPGEELLYDYGDRSKESLESHPWLKT